MACGLTLRLLAEATEATTGILLKEGGGLAAGTLTGNVYVTPAGEQIGWFFFAD